MKKLRLPQVRKLRFALKKPQNTRTPRPSLRGRFWWLGVAIGAVVVAFPYVAVHQNYRHGANDPQIQYAQDLSGALEQGASAEAFGGNSPVDPRKSLGLFLMAFGEDKAVLANTMQLDGDPPVPPQAVLDAAKNQGQQRFTWQPRGDVRVAAVLQHYGGAKPGYLLVGRSVAEIEIRQQQLAWMALGAMAVLVALVTIGVRVAFPAAPKVSAQTASAPERLTFDEPVTTSDSPAKNTPNAHSAKPMRKQGAKFAKRSHK